MCRSGWVVLRGSPDGCRKSLHRATNLEMSSPKRVAIPTALPLSKLALKMNLTELELHVKISFEDSVIHVSPKCYSVALVSDLFKNVICGFILGGVSNAKVDSELVKDNEKNASVV